MGGKQEECQISSLPKIQNVNTWTHLRIGEGADPHSNLDPIGSIRSSIFQICLGGNVGHGRSAILVHLGSEFQSPSSKFVGGNEGKLEELNLFAKRYQLGMVPRLVNSSDPVRRRVAGTPWVEFWKVEVYI